MLKPGLQKGPLRLRQFVKRYLYSMLSFRNIFMIALGKQQPTIEFTVEDDPPSVYFNYRVRENMLEAYRKHLALPDNFELCPIQCLEDESPEYILTLNVYRVSGLANGVRAEWSTYIRDAEGIPRYMVVEARDHSGSMDPLDIYTRKTRVEQNLNEIGFSSIVESANQRCFRATCERSAISEATRVNISKEWIVANDYIYWRNGICDRVFYDGGLSDPKTLSIDPDKMTITDDTEWAQFLEERPRHIILFESAIAFIISPWVNI